MNKPFFVFGGLALILASFGSQNKVYSNNYFNKAKCNTHQFVLPPPSISSKNLNLLIGLKAKLGAKLDQSKEYSGIQLNAFNRPLTLRDADGLIHKSSEIKINWKKIRISKPININRKVIGPFASFESAENIAKTLSNKGKCVFIANPNKWEVWTPTGMNLPVDMPSYSVNKRISYKLVPFLKIDNNQFSLSGPIEISSLDGIKWQGGIYSGPFFIQPNSFGSWTLIEKVFLEKYLEGVVPYEIGSSSPKSALAAQAVLARTWALANTKRYLVDGYHLCSSTQCQVYKAPNKNFDAVKAAIQKTSGKVLTWSDQPIKAFYHASNGGVMASVEEAWSVKEMPYLKQKIDGSKSTFSNDSFPLNRAKLKFLLVNDKGLHGSDHKLFRWNRIVTSAQIKKSFALSGMTLNMPSEINVLRRGNSGRVVALEIVDSDSDLTILLELDSIRRTLSFLPSTLFIVKKLEEGIWEFQGGGFGHGVGLSQAGAIELALKGWNTEQILHHYYPGTKFGTLPENWIAP